MPKYLLDSNFFISAHRSYYPFDVVPSFWERVKELASDGIIASIDKVHHEIVHGNDKLKEWISFNLEKSFFADSSAFIMEYTRVAQWANSMSDHYKPGALNEFLQAEEADAWLVAGAMQQGTTIVTNEVSKPEMKVRIAIPEPCTHFNVSFCNTIEMFRELRVTI
jgi:hypothetical protein